MTLQLNTHYLNGFLSRAELEAIKPEVLSSYRKLEDGSGDGADFRGWLDLPVQYDKAEFSRIKQAADRVRSMCDVMIVIGIGGSYLGARAAVEYIRSPMYNALKKDTPDIYFTGNSISSSALSELLEICEGRDLCVNVISKSGTTTEPAIAFRIFRELLEQKYGIDGARERIFATTDKAHGALKQFADEMGYETFVVPDDIGGRYSVLTAVGLFPIAVAGIDLDSMMNGAADAMKQYRNADFDKNDCLQYAAIRNALYRNKNKVTEILVAYEPAAQLFCEWWKQLFGESEGKNEKGLYPSSVIFSTDLHSLGQYIQQGVRNIFETVIDIKKSNHTVVIPEDSNNIDELNYLAGKELHEVNRTAMQATLLAHTDGNVPNVVVEVEDRSAYTFGYMVYFFELACGVSGYTLGVNPFDQPGVEAYKKNMFALLGRPGYQEHKAALDAKKK